MNMRNMICIYSMLLVRVNAGPNINIFPNFGGIFGFLFPFRDCETFAPTPAETIPVPEPDDLTYLSTGTINGISGRKVGTAVALNRVGTRLVLGGNQKMQIYDSFTSNADNSTGWILAKDLSGDFSSWIQSIDMNSNGRYIVVSETDTDITDPTIEAPSDCTVRIYEQDADSSWSQVGNNLESETSGVGFGTSVVISDSGDMIAIGAPIGNYVEIRFFGTFISWTLNIDGFEDDSYFGASLSLAEDGETLAVGAPHSNNFTGAVHIVDVISRSLKHTVEGTTGGGAGAGDYFGTSATLSKDASTLVIGNTGASAVTTFAQVFRYNSIQDEYLQVGLISDEGTRATGWSIALSSNGEIAVIGMPYDNDSGNNAGKTIVITIGESSLSALATFPGSATGDLSGTSVAVSDDGTAIAIGAVGSTIGHVRIFNAE